MIGTAYLISLTIYLRTYNKYIIQEKQAMKRSPEIQRIYNSWRHIQQVVNNPNNTQHQAHRSRGLEIENEFGSWPEFRDYVLIKLGPQPTPQHKLIRKNQSKNFGHKNIMWGLPVEVGFRCARSCVVTYKKQSKTVSSWAKQFNVSAQWLKVKLNKAKTPAQVFRQYD